MTGRVPEQRSGEVSQPAASRLALLSFVVRSVAPSEMRMSQPGSWVPLDFAGVLERLDQAGPAEVSSA